MSTKLLDEWAERSALRYEPAAVARQVSEWRDTIVPRPGVTLDEALEAWAAFLLCDPTLPPLRGDVHPLDR